MYSIAIDEKDYFAPSSMSEVTITRFNQFLTASKQWESADVEVQRVREIMFWYEIEADVANRIEEDTVYALHSMVSEVLSEENVQETPSKAHSFEYKGQWWALKMNVRILGKSDLEIPNVFGYIVENVNGGRRRDKGYWDEMKMDDVIILCRQFEVRSNAAVAMVGKVIRDKIIGGKKRSYKWL